MLVILGKRADQVSALFHFYPLIFLLGATLIVSGCSSHFLDDREGTANQLAASRGWIAKNISTRTFTLRAYKPVGNEGKPSKTLTVYIEGDGFAWRTRYTPSMDPTPDNPISLKMALADVSGNAAYLARPCQFTIDLDRDKCGYSLWTSARYSELVIRSMDEGVSALKVLAHAQRIKLVGYSGGGVVAALLAARRNDVAQLITVASNLDIDYWTRLHGVSPLSLSLNPAKMTALKNVPQIHYVGERDVIVPRSVAESFLRLIGRDINGTLRTITGVDHECCWPEIWPGLQRKLD